MRLMSNDDKMITGIIGGSNFGFSGIRTQHLGASDYTLVTIAVDNSGSVEDFADELLRCMKTAIESCQKSPRSENLLLRVILFSSMFPGGINEVHGFKPLAEIDVNDYKAFKPSMGTPLYDASYSAIGATNSYAETLKNDDYNCNGIVFIITDGDDTSSTMSPGKIHSEVKRGIQSEAIESNIVVLLGVNAKQYKNYLESFQKEAGIDKFIDAGDATPGKLAKLADFVSQSVSSQSQSLGTGGPSQNISATI